MQTQAIIFDAFGTLVRLPRLRLPPYMALWSQVAAHSPLTVGEFRQAAMTQPLDLAEAAAFELQGTGEVLSDADLQGVQAALEEELAGLSLFPETLEVLESVRERGLRVGLCSNLAKPYGPPLLAALPAPHAVALSYAEGMRKPEPRLFARMCERLGSDPARTVMVGDSFPSDVRGARAAGLQALWLRRGGPKDEKNGGEESDAPTISDLRGVLDWLDSAES